MKKRHSLASGLTLIIIGALLLMLQFLPARFMTLLDISRQWPLILIGIGGLQFIGAVGGRPAQAIPAFVVGGIGGLLYYQSLSGNWESWAYAWTLIFVFIGSGIVVAGLLGHRRNASLKEGRRLIIMGLLGFALFGSLLGGVALRSDLLWPALLIGGGLWLLLRNVRRN
jgi:hypothetical protein